MTEMELASFSLDEVKAIKRGVSNDRPYAERMSLAFAARLCQVKAELREDFLVLDELDFLEGLRSGSKTKPEMKFKRPPMDTFWHKHYSAPRHILRNLGDRWGLEAGGNRDLLAMIAKVARGYGDDPTPWQGMIADQFALGGYRDRTARGLTGDWIIFAKHNGQNYYLDLATHEEGLDSERLYEKLRLGSAAEFPFAFGDSRDVPSSSGGQMVSELDIFRTAKLLIDEYGPEAWFEAAQRADRLLGRGDVDGARVWRRVLSAIKTLQDGTPPVGAIPH
jgi:hypothetical protein